MTKDLTQEEIVTKILSSNEILRKQKEKVYISNPEKNYGNLGVFLAAMAKSSKKETTSQTILPTSKYSFIKNSWSI